MFTLVFNSGLGTSGAARRMGRRAWALAVVTLVASFGVPALAQVITYEANALPEAQGWQHLRPERLMVSAGSRAAG